MRIFKILFIISLAFYIFWSAAQPCRFNLLSSADLFLHEAGHPIFDIFGEYVGIWGGTLMQLLVPALFVGYFFYQRQNYSASVVLCWFGQNFFHIAEYIKDARVQELPLVGGGEHDWNRLLFSMRVLQWDQEIGNMVWFLGVMIICCAVVLGIYFSCKTKISNEEY
jgi:hypothetical protein